MYPVQVNKHDTLYPHLPHAAITTPNPVGAGPIRGWLGLAIRKWQQRKMIAALHALDDRILWDIGMERCDIESIVRGFDERELRMVPLAAQARVLIDQPLQYAA